MGCRGAWNIAIKQFGGLNLGGFPLILGIVLCIFNSVKRETDSLGGVEPLNAPMLRRVDSFLLFLLSRLKEFSSHCFRIQVYHIIFCGCRQSPPSVDVWPILKKAIRCGTRTDRSALRALPPRKTSPSIYF